MLYRETLCNNRKLLKYSECACHLRRRKWWLFIKKILAVNSSFVGNNLEETKPNRNPGTLTSDRTVCPVKSPRCQETGLSVFLFCLSLAACSSSSRAGPRGHPNSSACLSRASQPSLIPSQGKGRCAGNWRWAGLASLCPHGRHHRQHTSGPSGFCPPLSSLVQRESHLFNQQWSFFKIFFLVFNYSWCKILY